MKTPVPPPEAADGAPEGRPDRGPSAAEIVVLLKHGRHHADGAREWLRHTIAFDPDDPDGLIRSTLASVNAWERFYAAWKAAGADAPYGWPDDVRAMLRRLCDRDWHPSMFCTGAERQFDRVKARAALDDIDARLDRLAAAVAGVDAPGNMAPAAPQTAAPAVVPTNPPDASVAGAPRGKSRRGKRDQGKGDQCVGVYMKYVDRGETPPGPTDIASEVGCSPATASRALKKWEDKRREIAKEAARDRYPLHNDEEF
jgi:hypothetical protein